MLADLTRALLDDSILTEDNEPVFLTQDQAHSALTSLSKVSWDAHLPPWKYIMLTPAEDAGASWRIANEDRKRRLQLMERIIRWQCGVDPLTEEEISGAGGLRSLWHHYLPSSATADADSMWSEIEDGVIA